MGPLAKAGHDNLLTGLVWYAPLLGTSKSTKPIRKNYPPAFLKTAIDNSAAG